MKRHALLLLGLFALVSCQTAAAAMACAVAAPAEGIALDCHGEPAEEAPSGTSPCPSVDKAPDWGKQPVFHPAFTGADFLPALAYRKSAATGMAHAGPQGRAPPLCELCRLLI